MMRNRIVVLALLLIGFSGCKEVEELTQFTMSFNNQVTIPANSAVNIPINLSAPDIQTNAQATFANNETNAASIDAKVLGQ